MAKAKPQESGSDEELAVAELPQANIATIEDDFDFDANAGAGLEGAGQEAFAIPFLTVLQKTSPQVDEDSGLHIPGARSGAILETVSGRLYDGKVGVLLVPCAYKRSFLRWGPRTGEGGGFKGELTPDEVALMRAKGQIVEMEGRLYAPTEDGSVNVNRSDRFSETRNHFCMLMDEEFGAKQVLLSLTSTQIKKSKALNSILTSVRIRGKNGLVNPPTYGNVIRMTTVSESNDKGSWYGVRFERVRMLGQTEDGASMAGDQRALERDIYEAARQFHETVMAGAVAARFEDSGAHPEATQQPSGF